MTTAVQPDAPQAPQIVNEHAPFAVDAAMADIAGDAIKATLAESAPAEETPTRDEKGRFLPKEPAAPGEPVPTNEAMVADAIAPAPAPVAAEPAPVVLPEGFVAVPKVEGRELATPFAVMDAEGELEVPDMRIRFQANGKERIEPLDKVVKLAQFGVYNEERQRAVEQTKQESLLVQQQHQQILAYARQLEAERDAMLADDNLYIAKRDEYDRKNTPEMRLAAEQAQLRQQQDQHAFSQAASHGQQFFASELAPAVDTIMQALNTVAPEEIGAQLLLVSDRFRIHTPYGSIIPPSAYQAVRQALIDEVLPWAQQVHAARDGERQQTTAKTEAEKLALQRAADAAKVEAQKTKNTLTRAARPGQRAVTGASTIEAPPPKVLRTVEDFEQDAIQSAIRTALNPA